jgi:hypothetical protein
MAFDLKRWKSLSEADREAFFDGIKAIVAKKINRLINRISCITDWQKKLDWIFNYVIFEQEHGDPDYWRLAVRIEYDGPHRQRYYAESMASMAFGKIQLVIRQPENAFGHEIELNSEDIAARIFDKMLETHETNYNEEMETICQAKKQLAEDENSYLHLRIEDRKEDCDTSHFGYLRHHEAARRRQRTIAKWKRKQRRKRIAPWRVTQC